MHMIYFCNFISLLLVYYPEQYVYCKKVNSLLRHPVTSKLQEIGARFLFFILV